MPRALQTRVTYQADAAYLVKLGDAVERDKRFSREQKREIVSALNKVSILFMQAPTDTDLPTPISAANRKR